MSDQTVSDAPAPLAPASETAAPSFQLDQAVREKIAATGLTPAAAAKQLGVSPVAVANLLNKGSKPNARTAGKFAAWLGVDAALITGPAKAERAARPSTAARPAKAGKAPRAARSAAGTGAETARSTAEVLAIVKAALTAAKPAKPTPAHPILKDKLALAVHGADRKARAMIDLVLSKFA